MKIKFILFIIIFLCSNVYAVEYIGQQDGARIKVFSKDDRGEYLPHRSRDLALPYTRNISSRLTDHANIDYNRTATEAERETIYKAMMGTVIVHGGYSYDKTTTGHVGYENHFNALKVIDESIKALWINVQSGAYLVSLDQITGDSCRQTLLTPHFVKWFYEALESYRHELNFFGGTASFDWFQRANVNYANASRRMKYDLGTEYSSNKKDVIHIHIQDENGLKMAVLKPKPTTDENRRNDWLVSLAAKAIGLIDVINPAIPVRIESGKLVITTYNFTHILEPYVGISPDSSSQNMNQLLQNVRSNEENEIKKKVYTLNIHSFARYFENNSVPTPTRIDDLQTFNSSIDVENLVKLIAFWQVFKIKDMHDGNILWTLRPDGKFAITCIDYNLCFDDPMRQQPPLSMLRQATQTIETKVQNRVGAISFTPLSQVFRHHNGSMPECLSEDSFNSVKRILTEQPTVRHAMHEFYKKVEGHPSGRSKKRSDFCAEVGKNITVYTPLEIRPVGECHPGGFCKLPVMPSRLGYKSIFVEKVYGQGAYISYQVRYLRDWVFSAQSSEDLSKERFFNSSAYPAIKMWDDGMLPFNQFFSDRYDQILPKD
ncbi:hypothetical protein [Candidatus Finniella inopinata]|uniref:Uncharacterized protein n=1 Tax=Candidatus Finniella inopinata TaxID=1696036 RepID=A0A4Q7DHI7_9PROT|nr:hypothetical protein [Candidatus Finniella inopinata]RZI46391.1 hypothetical protein EQU50_02025 [Candidatus Finniella inopinata]